MIGSDLTGQDDKGLVDDARDDQMPRAADLARRARNAPPAVPQVVVDAASDECNARTSRVLEQIRQSLLNQGLVSPSAEGAELGLASPQDFVQLSLRGPREQNIA